MFSSEFCEISKDTFSTEHLQTTASEQEYMRAQLDVAQWLFLQFFVRQVRWSVTPIDFMSN